MGLLALAGGFSAASAAADEADVDHAYQLTAQRLAEEGKSAYEAHQYDSAVDSLSRSYAVVPDPTVGFVLGQALEQLGRLREALAQYKQVAQSSVGSERSRSEELAVDDAAANARSLRERIPSVRIRIRGATPEQVEIRVDDQPISSPLPETLSLDPGKHVVTVAKGTRVVTREIELAESAREVADFDLRPLQRASPPAASASPSAWPWIVLGGGAVILATAVTAGVLSLQQRAELDRVCTADHRCPSAYGAGVDRYNTLRILTIAGLAAGIAGTGVGIVLLLTRSTAEEHAPATKIEARVGLGELRLSATF